MSDLRFIVRTEWDDFAAYIIQKNRFSLNNKWQRYIDYICRSAHKRKAIMRKGETLFRARMGSYRFKTPPWPNKWATLYPHPLHHKKMGAPPAILMREGRLNPKGITYLYLATDEKTALRECLPWVSAFVTVARFKLQQNIKILDLTTDMKKPPKKGGGWRSEEERVWFSLNNAFSEPVSPEKKVIDYIPTQYIAEVFKNNGWHGIKYKSSLSKTGCNIALFNKKLAKVDKCCLHSISNIALKSRRIGRWNTIDEIKQRPCVFY